MIWGRTHSDSHSHLHYNLLPAGVDRIVLDVAPRDAGAAPAFVPTRAALHTLSLLTQRHQGAPGEFFWLGDPAGCGKTHFLNHYLALRGLTRASQPGGRELILALDYSASHALAPLEHDLLAALVVELGSGHTATAMWPRIGAQAAFEVVLEEAWRAGVQAITVAIDFGDSDAPAFAADLVQIARASKRPGLLVLAAGAGPAPPQAVAAAVGPYGPAEQLVAAVSRARRLDPGWTERDHLYRGVEVAPFTPEEIFPFHPQTLWGLSSLEEPATVAGLARTARDLLSLHKNPDRLISPYDFFDSARIRHNIQERLGAGGRAALRLAASACPAMARSSRQLAVEILRTLVIAHVRGEIPVELDDLWSRIPVPPWVDPDGDSPEKRKRVLLELAMRSSGAIKFGAQGAAFVPVR